MFSGHPKDPPRGGLGAPGTLRIRPVEDWCYVGEELLLLLLLLLLVMMMMMMVKVKMMVVVLIIFRDAVHDGDDCQRGEIC
ncbi:hypothetical protein EYF80_022693 [Liparis tanakae]|uniref:Uncharacterized protein n=1 Tax=Liparis tanakae TaxID=230148 RepID=A0A4Z2HMS0_9TELE|nr:hypothetical protein EYF80_022693 [Liparis tanakae]